MIKELTHEVLYDKLKHVKIGGSTCRYTMEKCAELTPLINDINRLKAEKNAVILAHSYVSPEIIYGVADFSGDSYGLSKDAMGTRADIIVFAAVKFMAETAKILNPDREVYIPGRDNGCSLADSITADDVRQLRKTHPDFAFVCYINTTAEVKAECDVCVTSTNVYDIIERFPSDKIFFVPDKLMGENVIEALQQRGVNKDIRLWDGTCYVHEEYDPEMVTFLRGEYPEIKVLSHPECSPGVVHESDFVGSTSQLLNYVRESDGHTFLMLTECGLTARIQVEMPEKTFVGTCTMCKYMKSNTLEDILRVLEDPDDIDRIDLDDETMKQARRCIKAMFAYAE